MFSIEIEGALTKFIELANMSIIPHIKGIISPISILSINISFTSAEEIDKTITNTTTITFPIPAFKIYAAEEKNLFISFFKIAPKTVFIFSAFSLYSIFFIPLLVVIIFIKLWFNKTNVIVAGIIVQSAKNKNESAFPFAIAVPIQ